MGCDQDPLSETHLHPPLAPPSTRLNNQLPHTLNRVFIPEAEVELCGTNWFVRWVVLGLEVEVAQGLFASHSFRRIEVEHPRQEINREGIFVGDDKGTWGLIGSDRVYSWARGEPTRQRVCSDDPK